MQSPEDAVGVLITGAFLGSLEVTKLAIDLNIADHVRNMQYSPSHAICLGKSVIRGLAAWGGDHGCALQNMSSDIHMESLTSKQVVGGHTCV